MLLALLLTREYSTATPRGMANSSANMLMHYLCCMRYVARILNFSVNAVAKADVREMVVVCGRHFWGGMMKLRQR